MASGPITSWQVEGEKVEAVTDFIFLGSKITMDGDFSCEIKRCFLLGRTNLVSVLKSRDISLLTKFCIVKAMVSNSHVQMWELDHKEGWALKNQCFQTVVLKKAPESPLDSKEIKPVHPKGNRSRIFIGRTVAEAEALTLWRPYVKSWFTGKDPAAGKDWRQKEKGRKRIRLVDSIIDSTDMSLSQLWETVEDRASWDAAVHGVEKSWTQLSDWTITTTLMVST